MPANPVQPRVASGCCRSKPQSACKADVMRKDRALTCFLKARTLSKIDQCSACICQHCVSRHTWHRRGWENKIQHFYLYSQSQKRRKWLNLPNQPSWLCKIKILSWLWLFKSICNQTQVDRGVKDVFLILWLPTLGKLSATLGLAFRVWFLA
jgi:hypothetical protein